MKRSLLIFMLSVFVAVASCSFTTKKFDNPDKDKLLIDLIKHVLSRSHYDAKTINDDFSQEVFKDYINAIDPWKRYFLKSDIEEFKEYENKIDDQILVQDLSFFDLTYERLKKRSKEARGLYEGIMTKSFDYSKDETIRTDYEEQAYVDDIDGLKNRWRLQLKFNALSNFYDKIKEQEQQLKLDDSLKNKDFKKKARSELKKEAFELTKTSFSDYFNSNEDFVRKDYFTMFINSIVMEFDPHTYYFAPSEKDRFDISMSGKLEGIGARLQRKGDQVKVTDVISGGPAWRGEEVEVGDYILKVKQEDEEAPVSIVGMRLDDAVNLIKGPKGTKVYLTLKKVDGTIEEIVITRDVVELEETYAKSSIVKKEGKVFGLINLPKFYFNMQNYNERNAALDVEQEIVRLKQQKMDGLVIDLRNNGGGSLQTVVEIAGLFIKEGPVVQVKYKERAPEVLKDKDEAIVWDGPLVILVNELSASASEILAAAMQDYKRAIVIGSKQTYGKGTVQNVMDLNRWMRNNEFGDLGALKLTTQKFYRVNGGSTQLEGVKSDVVVPDRYSYIDIGEKDQENPLAWDKIAPAQFEEWNGFHEYEATIQKSKSRMIKNAQLQLIDQNAKWVKEKRDVSAFSLSFDKYKMNVETTESQSKTFEAIDEYSSDLTYESLPYEKELITKDTVLGEKRKRWHKSLKKDVYVEEAFHVLEDMVASQNKTTKVSLKN